MMFSVPPCSPAHELVSEVEVSGRHSVMDTSWTLTCRSWPQIADMQVMDNLAEADDQVANIDSLLELTKDDFPEDASPTAMRAAEIASARVTAETRGAQQR